MAAVSLRFPENTKPVGVTVEIGLEEAWEILREQKRISYHDNHGVKHDGTPGLTRQLIDKIRDVLTSYPDPYA